MGSLSVGLTATLLYLCQGKPPSHQKGGGGVARAVESQRGSVWQGMAHTTDLMAGGEREGGEGLIMGCVPIPIPWCIISIPCIILRGVWCRRGVLLRGQALRRTGWWVFTLINTTPWPMGRSNSATGANQ